MCRCEAGAIVGITRGAWKGCCGNLRAIEKRTQGAIREQREFAKGSGKDGKSSLLKVNVIQIGSEQKAGIKDQGSIGMKWHEAFSWANCQ
jgi:hypothetical protein